MNSLENLNNWSNDDILYNGNAVYSITFDASTPTNQSTTAIEDEAFVAPPGINITGMESTPRDIEFTVDLSAVALPASIDWGALPYFISSQIAGTNIFKLTGPITADIWNQIKYPSITIIDQAAGFSFVSTITYPDPANTDNNLTKSWTTSVTVVASPNISSPTAYKYTKNSVGTIAGYPQITNTVSGTYSIVVTPSSTSAIYTLSSFGTGGTSVFDTINKTLTLSGTRAQVNSHLSSIQLTTVVNETSSFVLGYRLTNPSGVINTVNQNLSVTDPFVINTATYVEDTTFDLGYTINDASTSATSFSISVAQTTPLPSLTPGYFTVNGSNVGTSWSSTDTRAAINAANVVYTPPVDYTGTLTFTVNQSKQDRGNTEIQISNQPVNIVNAGTNSEITNMINRSYYSNTVNSIFGTQTPYINDGSDLGQSYTITLSSSLGKFGNSAANAIASSSYSFTGNMSSTNNEFSNMVFVPNPGAASTGTFTYTQSRSGFGSQVNASPVLNGINSNITPATYIFTANSTFTPTWEEYYYGNARVMIAGGGAAGGAVSGSGGSGGGGGGAVSNTTFKLGQATQFQSGEHTITVGTGGTTSSRNGTASSISYGNTILAIANGGFGGTVPNGGNSGTGSGGASGSTFAGGGGGGAGGSGFVGSSQVGGGGGAGKSFSLENAYTVNYPGQTIYGGGGGGGGKGTTTSGTGGSYGGGNARSGNISATSWGGGGGAPNGLGYQGIVTIYIR